MTAGAGPSREGDDEELALLLELELIDGFEQRGPLPEEKISQLLFLGVVCSFGPGRSEHYEIGDSHGVRGSRVEYYFLLRRRVEA